MFHGFTSLLAPPPCSSPGLRQALKRALLLGAGLALLWVAAHRMPPRLSPPALDPAPAPEVEIDVQNARYASKKLFPPGYAPVHILMLG